MELIPLHDYVVLQEIEEKLESAAGIIIPEQSADAMEITIKAKIIKLPLKTITWTGSFDLLNEGDTVLFKRHLFEEVHLDAQKFMIGKEENIIAVVK